MTKRESSLDDSDGDGQREPGSDPVSVLQTLRSAEVTDVFSANADWVLLTAYSFQSGAASHYRRRIAYLHTSS